MKTQRKVYLLMMMAGKGTRFGADVPKQFVLINDNEPIFIYSLKHLNEIDKIDEMIVITNADYLTETQKWIKDFKINKVSAVLTGGAGRQLDVLKGLKSIKNANANDIVLIYDATHPIVDKEGCEKVIDALYENDAVTLAEYQFDTTYKIDKETDYIVDTIDRKEIIAGASPEGFKYKVIFDTFNNFTEEDLKKGTSAGAVMLKNNIKMLAIKTNVVNLKITYPADFDNFIKIANSERN